MGWTNLKPGQTFGRWVVLGRDYSKSRVRYYNCRCRCNTVRSVRGCTLVAGKSLSCGCLAAKLSSIRNSKQVSENYARQRGTLAYFKSNTWNNLQKRVVNSGKMLPQNKSYIRKGIKCLMTKDEFYAWCDSQEHAIMALYETRETPSIDRIDSGGHYTIQNIQILSHSENSRKGGGSGTGCTFTINQNNEIEE